VDGRSWTPSWSTICGPWGCGTKSGTACTPPPANSPRLCLARSLAIEPSYLLADESTSALDPISSRTVEELFVKLKKDYSIVMVTHTLRQARRIADHVIFMYLGEVIEEGDADQVFNHPRHELTQQYLGGAFS